MDCESGAPLSRSRDYIAKKDALHSLSIDFHPDHLLLGLLQQTIQEIK